MRRGVTVLLVVVVAAIALAAGFDALRDDDSPQVGNESEPEASSVSTTEPDGPTNYVPLESGLGGTLYYTDEGCQLQAVELPGVEPAEAPNWNECNFVLSPTARRVAGAGSGWDPRSDPNIGRLFQSQGGRIQISTNAGPEGKPFAGNAPAWRPDGTLTYFADGAVREWPSGDVVLSQRDLVRALRTLPIRELATRYDRFRVREAAWLDDRRLAAILSADGPEFREDMLAIYDGTELDQFTFDGPRGLSELRASPGGRYVAARSTGGRDAPGGFVMIESGRELNTPRIVGYRALAWSPDEQWVAIAAEGGVFVYRPGAPGPPELELDLDAQDLAWRGDAPPPPIEADAAREWLGEAGGTGRLLVTDSECHLRALRLPDLVWEEEPDVVAPCRFTLTPSDMPLDDTISVSPTGELTAICDEDGLRVFQDGVLQWQLPNACGPAWMGDGTLTFIRGGGLWRGIVDANEFLSRQELSELVGRPSALEEIAWADDERFWAVVRSEDSAIVALLTTDRLVSSPSFTTRTIEGLRVSSTGMVAARTDQGVVFFDTGGQRAMTFPDGHAVAWAPGELIAAVATTNEIQFVAPLSREVVSVPLAVRDLEWVVP